MTKMFGKNNPSWRPIKDRFWEKVDKSGECWIWTSNLSKGYGAINHNGKTVKAHRLSWQWCYGEIPKNIFVLHKCDNPKCVRPDHLFLGTAKDNAVDRDKKGRGGHGILFGEEAPGSKLYEKDVLKIRNMYKTGKFSHYDLSKIFKVTRAQIGSIVRGVSWKHICI